MVDGRTLTRRAALGSIVTGAVLFGHDTYGFSSIGATRRSTARVVDDSTAFLTITGKSADETPSFRNRTGSSMDISLTAPNEDSAEFDVGGDGSFEDEASFTLPSGGEEEVQMSADVAEITVSIEGVFGEGSIALERAFEIPQSNQVDITPTVASSGGSGKFEFGLANEGTIDAVMTAIRVDRTSTNAVAVDNKDIFSLDSSEYASEDERQLVSERLDIGEDSPLTEFDGGDTVTIPAPTDGEERGDELLFEFDRFVDENGKNEKMAGANVAITVGFEDASSESFELDDGE